MNYLLRIACFLIVIITIIVTYFFMVIVPFPNGSVIVPRYAGSGNQMFIYAAGYSLAKKTNSKLYVLVDEADTRDNGLHSIDRNFVIHQLGIPKNSIIYKSKLNKIFLRLHRKIFFIGTKSDIFLEKLKKKKNKQLFQCNLC